MTWFQGTSHSRVITLIQVSVVFVFFQVRDAWHLRHTVWDPENLTPRLRWTLIAGCIRAVSPENLYTVVFYKISYTNSLDLSSYSMKI